MISVARHSTQIDDLQIQLRVLTSQIYMYMELSVKI